MIGLRNDLDPSDTSVILDLYTDLRDLWIHQGTISLGAYYQYLTAEQTNTPFDWEIAGDGFLTSLGSGEDTLIKNNLITFALASYEAVLSSDSNNINCRYKLAKVHILHLFVK